MRSVFVAIPKISGTTDCTEHRTIMHSSATPARYYESCSNAHREQQMNSLQRNKWVSARKKVGTRDRIFNIRIRINKSSAVPVAEMGDRGHNRHGHKRGGAVPLSRSAGNPSNTMWSAPMSTSVASGVFIHPAVWPQ